MKVRRFFATAKEAKQFQIAKGIGGMYRCPKHKSETNVYWEEATEAGMTWQQMLKLPFVVRYMKGE